MSRRSAYKSYVPSTALELPGYVKPANADIYRAGPIYYEPPPTIDDQALTEAEFEEKYKVDEASKVVSHSDDRTAQSDYHFIGVDTTIRAVTITLPEGAAVSSGKILLIKDEGGNAGTNNITVDTSDGATIDGASSVILNSDYAAINIYYNGSGWHIY